MIQKFHSWVYNPEKIKIQIQNDTCTPMFRVALYHSQDMEAAQVPISRLLN